MYKRLDYYLVDRLGYYYAGHKDGFADYTKDIAQARKFRNYDLAKVNADSLHCRVVGIER